MFLYNVYNAYCSNEFCRKSPHDSLKFYKAPFFSFHKFFNGASSSLVHHL